MSAEGVGEGGWQDVGRRFFEDLSDEELKRQIARDSVALVRFENAVRALPVDAEKAFTAEDLRAKIARFERERTERAARR